MSGVVGAAVLLAGCTSGSSGSNSPQSSAAASSSSSQQLDTGTFATTARAPFGVAKAGEIPPLESQRLAEFTTLPQEIDSRFSKPAYPIGALVNSTSVNDMFGLSSADTSVSGVAIDNGLTSGYYGSAGDLNSTSDAPGASITHGVIRFASPDAASKAAQGMYDALRTAAKTKTGDPTSYQPFSDPALPNSLVLQSPASAGGGKLKGLTALTAHRSYLIVDLFVGPPTENNGVRDLRRSLDLQIPLIDRFPATPLKGGRIQQDQNKILIYALTNPNPRTALNDGVYGPRGYAFTRNNQVQAMQQLEEAGAEHTAVAGTTVFRASTQSAATTLFNQLVAADGSSPAASPSGLTSAKCLGDGEANTCYVQVGRYIGQTNIGGDLKQAQQQISAQYKILLGADQSTPN
ncbi:hypothetical protein [uncultured Williamsia sp.]|uniref:DUF7373 family lipoprotein n=1 Tax=uncultured Williamsia sp. TaxID=259311 RepID=UPI0026046F94|nr:hypothetical protein [uncultured Williamsia sp.]